MIWSSHSIKNNIPFQANIGHSFKLSHLFNVSVGVNDITGIKKMSIGTSLKLDNLELNYGFSNSDALGGSHSVGVKMTSKLFEGF